MQTRPGSPIRRASILPLLAVCSILACGGSGDAETEAEGTTEAPTPSESPSTTPSEASADGVLGTIEATVDGQARTWFVVTGSVRGEPYSSAVWFETPNGELIASLGGFDTDDLPFDEFQTDPAQGVSLGGYDGSALTVTIRAPEGEGPYSTSLTEDNPGVTWAPDASVGGITGVYFGRSGSLTLTRLEIVGDLLTAEGSFGGTLRLFGGEGAVEVSDGRFSIRGVPNRSAVAGG